MLHLLLSIYETLFSIPIHEASSSSSIQSILLHLLIDCASSALSTAIALPFLVSHFPSLCNLLNASLRSPRRATQRAALRCVACSMQLLARWEEWECGYTGNPVLLEWLAKDDELERVKKGVQESVLFFEEWLESLLTVDFMETSGKDEIEMIGSVYDVWIQS